MGNGLDALSVFLFVFFLVLAVVTLVGHGIWVLLAAILGGLRGSAAPRPTVGVEQLHTCPRCYAALTPKQQVCGNCNWPHAATLSANEALASLRQQVEVFRRQRIIDADSCAQLLAGIGKEEQRVGLRASQAEASSGRQPTASVPAPLPTPLDAPLMVTPVQGALANAPPPELESSRKSADKRGLSVAERAIAYAASRYAAMTQAAEEAKASTDSQEPPRRREAISRLLAAFMEEKNIRWGELVGGLLIVGCSIALVISFWSQIASQPLLKFVLFNGVTAALFAIGMYTDHRWKIHTTSHGLLVIATVLVPLNFLAIAAFTQSSPPTDLLSLGGEGISLIGFALLVYFAGRILVPRDAGLLAAAVMIPSLTQLLIRRFARPECGWSVVYGLAAVPLLTYFASVLIVVTRRWVWTFADTGGSITDVEANRTLMFLGVATAAFSMPLALLLYLIPPLSDTLHWLSPIVLLSGVPAVVTGLLFWRRLNDQKNAGLQTVGIAVGVVGACVIGAGLVLAWPDPAMLLPTAFILGCGMLAVAIGFGIAAAHLAAGLAFVAAALVIAYVARGDVAWAYNASGTMRDVLLSATTGHILLPLVAIVSAIAAWLEHRARREPAKMYGLVAAIAALAGLALAVWFGFGRSGDPENVTWTIALYAIMATVTALALDRTDLGRIGSAFLLVAIGQGVVYRFNPAWRLEQPWIAALLAHASLVTLICVLIANLPSAVRMLRNARALAALAFSAIVSSSAAALWLIAVSYLSSAGALASYLAWLGAVWLVLFFLVGSVWLFTASQAVFVGAILCGTTWILQARDWYFEARHPWLDPWFLEVQGIALAGYGLLVSGLRRAFARARHMMHATGDGEAATDFLHPGATYAAAINQCWFVVQVVAIAVVTLAVCVSVYAVLPGAAQELSPTQIVGQRAVTPIEAFQIAGIPHGHAADGGAWLLLAAALVSIASHFPWLRPGWRQMGLALLGILMCLLLAARWEQQVAVASAIRWLSAALLVAGAVVIGSFGPSHATSSEPKFRVRDLLLGFVILVYAAAGAYVAYAALRTVAAPSGITASWKWIVIWTTPLIVVSLVLFLHSATIRETAGPSEARPKVWAAQFRWVVLVLGIAPLAVVVTFLVASSLDRMPIVGPEPTSWFRRIGFDWSYGVPLVAIATTLIGYAIVERSSPFAFGAGMLLNVVATIVLLMRLAKGASALDGTAWITVAQLNALVASLVALVWMGIQRLLLHEPRSGDEIHSLDSPALDLAPKAWRRSKEVLLTSQVVLASAVAAAYLLPSTVRLSQAVWPGPFGMPAWVAAAGRPLGWLAVIFAAVAAACLTWRRPVGLSYVAILFASFVALVAITVLRTTSDEFAAYRTLLVGASLAAWLLPPAAAGIHRLLAGDGFERLVVRWSALPARIFDLATVWLALSECNVGPSWWGIGALAATGMRQIAIAWREGGRHPVWFAAASAIMATSIWWLALSNKAGLRGPGDLFAFLWINVVAVAVMAVISVWLERRKNLSADTRGPLLRGIAFHRFAAWTAGATLVFTTSIGLFADCIDEPFAINQRLAWIAWLAAMVAAVACLWDVAIRWPIACSYCLGLVSVGIYLDGLDLRPPFFQWALANALASYSLATSTLWMLRERVITIGQRLGVPAARFTTSKDVVAIQSRALSTPGISRIWSGGEGAGWGWLVPANFVIGLGVLLLVTQVQLSMASREYRLVAAYAVGAQAVALALLAKGSLRTPLQHISLLWGAVFAVTIGWALVPPDFPSAWLHRAISTVVALAAVVAVYGLGLVKFLKRENEWTRAAARLVPVLATLAIALILTVLAIETYIYLEEGAVPIAPAALMAVAVALVGLAVAALVAALVPGRDPLGLTDRGRTLYVYIAEGLSALLFLHIRLTMPWLFSGWFTRLWPLVVMVIAFGGVGLAEVFRRRQQRVLYEPLENTGALLPLLPLLGYWAVPNQTHYSVLLLSIGVLYAALCVLRASFLYGLLATIAANGSLWFYLHQHEGLDFATHPQLWLIPPALCALAAGYINRTRLSTQQSAALRFASATVIYASSTAEIFLNGVAEAPWLPAVLAGISIAGVLAGIVLRVQSFLYLGTTFLVIAILTVIWHAADGHTWVWWIAGIVTGILIIALFGLFEKRREDVLRMVEELKHWPV